MKTLFKFIDLGQSCWLDNLSRRMIRNGELKKRVMDQGIRGITSNPSIFNKSISKSSDYDDQMRQLVHDRLTVPEIYENLVIKDIQDACDILRQVFNQSDGLDGFVSLEVSPYLAHDSEGTKKEARRLFRAVDRSNCLIKIPGTPAGLPAIEEMLYEGVNVNVTLLFSVESYEAVANAYIGALERRVGERKEVKSLASVASFFLSRIDVLADQLLGHLIIPERIHSGLRRPELLFGKMAIASAKLAYQSFKKIFSGNRWQRLVEKGGRVQRPLWASTSTKDPLYCDVQYVEPLIGPYTVNTMPEETIKAVVDHGVIEGNSIEKDLDEAFRAFDDFKKVGLDIRLITSQLVNEGVQKFIEPYDQLLKSVAEKCQQFLVERIGRQRISYVQLKSDITSAFKSLDGKQFCRRLFEKDPILWKSDYSQAEAIRGHMGWLGSLEEFSSQAGEIEQFAQDVKNARCTHVVLLGMGGSSLCPEVAQETIGSAPDFPELLVLDNTDPAAVKKVESHIEFGRTLFLVASKSGTTTETTCFYEYFYGRVLRQIRDNAGKHFVAITDSGTPLVREAEEKKFRRIFINPPDIGGRYSALSYFGLVPMALLGIDVKAILAKAHQLRLYCGPFIPSEANPGVSLGTLLGLHQREGRNKVTFIFTDSISPFGHWVEQLLAESTGKEGSGLIPVVGETLGNLEVYNMDRVFVYLSVKGEESSDTERNLLTLEKAGHPVVRIEIPDKLSLGAEFFHWELATATAGSILGINPFDQPNVSESKKNTDKLLEEWRGKGAFNEGRPLLVEDHISIFCDTSAKWLFKGSRDSVAEFLKAFLNLAGSSDYLAFLTYFLRTPSRHETLQSIRLKLRDRLRIATTLGYGPRYLHSTGQLHKGGPNNGLFILFTADPLEDASIPGEDFGFATLQRAQALGDFRSLNDKQRRIIRVHLGRKIDTGLSRLEEILK